MAYVTEFQNDLFISYAHIDNQALSKEQRGWIDEFHRALEIRLQELLGDRPKIWRDPKLQGNDVFSDELVDQFSTAAVLVSVISPRYVKSEWCIRELTEFIKAADKSKGLVIENKSRIFKVLKTMVPHGHQPDEVEGLLGYEFYEVESATGRPREFRHEFGPEAVKNFWAKLDDLAWDIRLLLETLRSVNGHNGKQTAQSSGPSLYLAETSHDLSGARDNVKRELQHLGFNIFPDKALPLVASDLHEVVRSQLAQCRLSIHLVGENYGVVPEGETRSLVTLQNELAAERSDDASFARLIWMPPGLQPREPRQQEFVTFLQTDSDAQKGADVLQVPLEQLKTVIQEKLAAKQKPRPPEVSQQRVAPARIYLICEQVDLENTGTLESHLFDEGFEVLLPAFEDDEAVVREAHKDNLLLCDAVIIFYGQASDTWVRSKLRDLLKAPGYGRETPLSASLVYLAAPDTPQKQRFRTHEAMVVKNVSDFDSQEIAPFLSIVQAQRS